MEELLKKYNKEDKLLIKNTMAKLKKNSNSYFLDMYQYNLLKSILNKLNMKYNVYNENLDRKIIYLENLDVVMLKVIPKVKNKLLHKDYMGAIYNMGIAINQIGDVIVSDDCGYFYTFNNIKDYYINNLFIVGNIEVEVVEIEEIEIEKKYINKSISCSSLRADNIISKLYNLSRKEASKKIINSDLIVNSIVLKNGVKELKIGDIVSMSKHGKFRINDFKINKKNKYIIDIDIYI